MAHSQTTTAFDRNLASAYGLVRATSEDLCSTLTVEDHGVQSMPDASPAKWHLAHTSWFFETFLLTPYLTGYRPLDPDYRYLFNSYYNAIGDRPLRQTRGSFSRPSLDEVREYRRYVDAAMEKLLGRGLNTEVLNVVALGLNHEQQHQELIVTDVKHALWSNPLQPAFRPQPAANAKENTPAIRWHPVEEGIYEIGHRGPGFAFDNESPHHKVYIHKFEIASRLTTNGEYLKFMEDGGYQRPELWLSDGWESARTQGWQAPLYWEKDGRALWLNYTCAGTRPVDENAPVCHVSFYEADAYARWADARLATEAEWEVVAQRQDIEGNLLERGEFHPRAASGNSPGPQQMFGDVWEWTQSAYSPYPGYKPVEGALGEYNAKFMCNQMVLRGGSCATPQSHIRASYRNFFPPQARWQFSGIRLAR